MKLSKYVFFTPIVTTVAFMAIFYFFKSIIPEDNGPYLLWGCSAVLLNAAFLWSLGISVLIIREFLSDLKIIISIIVLVAGIAVVIESTSDGIRLVSDLKNLYSFAYWVAYVDNFVAMITIGMLLSACCILTRSGIIDSPEALSKRLRYFSISLYSSVALLSIGVVEVFFLLNLCNEVTKVDKKILYSLLLGFGVLYSGVLISIYLPTAALLDRKLNETFAKATQGKEVLDRKLWMTEHKFPASPLTHMRGLFAMLLPLSMSGFIKLLEIVISASKGSN